MQLYALDDQSLTLATKAEKHKNYQCPECLAKIRLRGGPHRQFHFYHLHAARHCRQQKKSLKHLQAQLILKSLLPPDEAILEKSFPSIGRIADVCWEKKKSSSRFSALPSLLKKLNTAVRTT